MSHTPEIPHPAVTASNGIGYASEKLTALRQTVERELGDVESQLHGSLVILRDLHEAKRTTTATEQLAMLKEVEDYRAVMNLASQHILTAFGLISEGLNRHRRLDSQLRSGLANLAKSMVV